MTIPGTPISKALNQIGAKCGFRANLGRGVEDSIVLISASQVTADDLRKQIERTLNASFELREGTYTLTKSSKQLAEDNEISLNINRRTLKMTLDKRRESLKLIPVLDRAALVALEKKRKDSKASPIIDLQTPTNRFASRILLSLALNSLSDLPRYQRVVYSTSPNRMQKPLRINIEEAIKMFESEAIAYQQFFEEEAKKQTRSNSEAAATQPRAAMVMDGNTSLTVPPRSGISAVLLAVDSIESMGVNLSVRLVPKNPAEGSGVVEIRNYEGMFADMKESDFETPPPPETFKLSEASLAFQKFKTRQQPKSTDEKWLDRFADVTQYDPLSYGLSESIIFEAKQLKKNVIAVLREQNLNIDEPIWLSMVRSPVFNLTLPELVYEDSNWICVRKSPDDEITTPRPVLKKLIEDVRTKKEVTLETRAKFASIQPRTNTVSYVERLLEHFAPSDIRESNADRDVLILWNLMTLSEKQAAQRPEGVLITSLSEPVKRHLYACAYFNHSSRLYPRNWQTAPPTKAQEPTLAAPEGFLPSSTLKITKETAKLIKQTDTLESGGLLTDAKGWGSTLFQIEHPELYRGSNFRMDDASPLFAVTADILKVEFTMSPDFFWSGEVKEVKKTDAKTFTIRDIPDEFKADFKIGYEEAKKAMSKRSGG